MTTHRYSVSFEDDENILKLDIGASCTTLANVLKTTELYTLKG